MDKHPIPKDTCPCTKSDKTSWKLDCTQCSLTWHSACSNLKGKNISQQFINELDSWLCPWCFESPVPKPNSHPTYKKSETLLTTVITDAIVKNVTDNLNCFVNSKLDEIKSAETSHNDFMKEIQTSINQLNKHKQDLDNCVKSDSYLDSFNNGYNPGISEEKREVIRLEHSETPVNNKKENFLDESIVNRLHDYLSTCKTDGKFKEENGHSVLLLGEKYKYRGARAENTNPVIPGVVNEIIKKINDDFEGDYDLNSALVNYYGPGDSSYLPEHSDDEGAINPESCIFTYSIGRSRSIIFRDILSGEDILTHNTENNTIYTMTRNSQNFYSHRIDKYNEAEERYSITFRCVNPRFRRSTT